ncbi:beta-ketoacyl synthase, N-terminal domain protein [Mycobacterium xenopi 4042]|uniref:Beta-ketoacyl synthase, N-terminal domain protein n=1 Tax=Mycobacterium xenopi 4042 TaxID=1299334 RepID=X8DLJ7_MYCXE|nr:beta-ketoacyl synthase, N-terminal domain protein [Mycobacterium xenopi 4042]
MPRVVPTSAQDYTVVAVRRRNGFIRGDQSWCGPLNFGEFVAHQGRHAGHSDCCHRHGLPASWRHRLPELLWEALLRGDDLVTEIPPDRWDADEYYDPSPEYRAGRCRSGAPSSTTLPASMQISSGSASRRRSRSTLSTGYCWKSLGKQPSTRG